MRRNRRPLLATLLSILVLPVAAGAQPVGHEQPEAPVPKPPPSLMLPDGSLQFPDGSLQGTAPRDNPHRPCFDDTHRFVSCGNGTVTDTATGLVWLEDLTCFLTAGSYDYPTANDVVATLSEFDCPALDDDSRPGDWRLPTAEEWRLLVHPGCPGSPPGDPKIIGNGSPTSGCYEAAPWAVGVDDSAVYWSAQNSLDSDKAVAADLDTGLIESYRPKTFTARIWPVRGDGRPSE